MNTLLGGAGDDVLSLNARASGLVSGGDGDYVISLTGGRFDAVLGGAGNDLIVVAETEAHVIFSAGVGDNVLRIEQGAR